MALELELSSITFGFMHISCLVHDLDGVWCLFQERDIHTMGNTLSGFVTQDPRVGPSEASAIHPTHPFCLIACTSEP